MKGEEEERLIQEAEQQRRRETPDAWEHYFAKQEEVNRRVREADLEGTTSKTWPPPQSSPSNFRSLFFRNLTIHYNSCLKGLMSAFVILL
jgi:5'-deoxynucleotidase YfbR-like HD superfamily hydrolase